MPPTAALERRIWRLAYLLTGDAAGAAALVDRVLNAQARPESLEPARLDRLIIQQARAPATSTTLPAPVHPRPPAEAARAHAAALALPHQPMEAWVLKRVDDVDELRMSRAMDCSRTAARNHLAAADDQMRTVLGQDADRAITALRAFADSLDPGPIISAHRAIRRKRALRRGLAIALVTAIAALSALLLAIKSGVLPR